MKSPPFFYIDDIIFFCVKDNILRGLWQKGRAVEYQNGGGAVVRGGVWFCGGGVEEKKMACKEKKDMIAY